MLKIICIKQSEGEMNQQLQTGNQAETEQMFKSRKEVSTALLIHIESKSVNSSSAEIRSQSTLKSGTNNRKQLKSNINLFSPEPVFHF